MEDKIEQLKNLIKESNNIVFFGGAGVSTESGIPDFRSKNGLYNQKYKYPPEGQEDALKTVISQCELWTDNVAEYEDTVSYSINDDYGTLKVAEKNLTVNNQNMLELNSIFKKYCIFLT